MNKKEAAPKNGPDHATRSLSDGLDDVLRAHAVAAKTAHTIGSALISARDELPEREYSPLLRHVSGLIRELHAARLPERLPE